MPTFELTSPKGETYRVDAPEGATEQQAQQMLQRQLAGLPSAPPKLAPPQSFGDKAMDFVKSIPGGMLGGLSSAASAGGQAAQIEMGQPVDVPGPEQTQQALEQNVTGQLPTPQGTAGQYGRTVGEFLGNPGSYVGPGGPLLKAGAAVVAGLGSEAGGQATKGTKAEPWARAAGAILSPVAARRLITPVPARNPARQDAVNILRREGVTDITAGQATGNKRLTYAESELGGSTAERMMERQLEQFTGAALRRVGENTATRATPDVIDQSFNRIGGRMNQLAAQNNVIADSALIHDLVAARDGYTNLVAQPMQAPILQNILDRISNSFSGTGIMPGRVYNALRSDIGRYARGARADPNLQRALYDIQNAVDENMQRVIARNNPNQLGAYREARRQYRNLLVIERASTYAGEDAAAGLISPSHLAGATKAVQQKRNYARGRGDFTPLARAGVEVLSKLPNSGTAQRLRAHSIPAIISAAIGGTAGSGGGPLGVAGGIAAGVAAPRLLGEAVLSRPGRSYLGNQLLGRDPHALATGAMRGIVSQSDREYGGPQ